MEILKRLYRIGFFVGRVLLAIGLLFIIAVQFSFFQEFLVNTFVLPADSKIKIEQSAGFFPFNFSFQKLSLSKKNVTLFQAEDIVFICSIENSLIDRKVYINSIGAKSLTIFETDSENSNTDIPIGAVSLFQNFWLDSLDLKKIWFLDLDGSSHSYSLNARSNFSYEGISFLAYLKNNGLQKEMSCLSIKQTPTNKSNISFYLSLSEKEGGLLSSLIYGERRSVSLEGKGGGNLSNFSGDFHSTSNLETINIFTKTFIREGKDIVANIDVDIIQGEKKTSFISSVVFDESLQNFFIEQAKGSIDDKKVAVKGHISRDNSLFKTSDLITEFQLGPFEIKGISSVLFNCDTLSLIGKTTGNILSNNSKTNFEIPYDLDLKNQRYNLDLNASLAVALKNKEEFDLTSKISLGKEGEGMPWKMQTALLGKWGKFDLEGIFGSNPSLKGEADIYQDSYDIFLENEEGGWSFHIKNKNNFNQYGIERLLIKFKDKAFEEIRAEGDFNVLGNKLQFDSGFSYDKKKENINLQKMRIFFQETFLEANGVYNFAAKNGNIFWHFYSFNISDLTRNDKSTGALDIVGDVDIQKNIPKFSFSGDINKLFYNKSWCKKITLKGEYTPVGKQPGFFEMIISEGGYRNNFLDSCKLEVKGEEKELLVSGSLSGSTKWPLKSSFSGVIKDFKDVELKKLHISFGEDVLALSDPVSYTFSDISSLTPIKLKINKGYIKTKGSLYPDQSDFSINFHEVSGAVISSMLGEIVELPGDLSGSVKIMGAACDPFVALSLMLEMGQQKVLQIDGSYKEKIFDIESKMNLFGLNLYSKARVPALISCAPFSFAVLDTDPISINLKGVGNIAAIHKLFAFNFDRLGGGVWADLFVNGSISNPVLSGNLRLKDGFYARSNIGLHLGDITFGQGKSGKILNGSLTVPPITITDGKGGKGNLYGDLKLGKNLIPWINFSFKSDGVRIINIPKSISGGLIANAFGEFHAKGPVNALKISGEGEINPFEQFVGEVEKKKIYRVNVVHVNLSEIAKERLKKIPILDEKKEGTELDLHFDLSKNFLIYGQGLKSRWNGSLDIKGVYPSLVYKGDFKLKKGTLAVMDRDFDVKKGSIYFHGALSPKIYIEAEHQMRDMKATFVLKGDAEDLQLEILSDKNLTQTEVLERLFFDREGNGAQAVQALNFLTRKLQNQFDAVKFGFYQVENPIDHTKEDVVSISKDLGDYFYAKGEVGLDRNPKASLGVHVKKNIKIEGSVTTNKKVGIGAEWKWRF